MSNIVFEEELEMSDIIYINEKNEKTHEVIKFDENVLESSKEMDRKLYSEEEIEEWRKQNNIKSSYKEGTILFIKEHFDSYTTILTPKSVSINKDKNFIESRGGIEGRKQDAYVINCFYDIDDEYFSNKFIFNKKEVKVGDTVYVLISGDGDPYGFSIIGVFTEKPDIFLLQEYVKHYESLFPKDYDFDKDFWSWKVTSEDVSMNYVYEVKVTE